VLIARKVVQIAGSSTSPLITSKVDDGFLFRTAPSDALQGKLLAKRAKDRGHTKVSIIHAPGAYGNGLASAFQTSFTGSGGTVPVKQEYTEKLTETDYNTMLNNLYASATPDAILLVGTVVDASNILKAYVNNHTAKTTYWYFTDSISVSELVAGVGANSFSFAHEGTKPGAPQNERYTVFSQAFTTEYGNAPGTFAVNAYDAMYLLALAIEAAGKADGPAIRDQMTAVSSGGTVFTPATLKEALSAARAAQDINYEGASGSVDFDTNGDVLGGYDIWQVKAGAVTVTESAVPAPQ
jgi:branched-chain amino acid transport system substrate-binding protein